MPKVSINFITCHCILTYSNVMSFRSINPVVLRYNSCSSVLFYNITTCILHTLRRFTHSIFIVGMYSKWQNCEGQFFLLKQMLTCPDIVKLTECLPCTKPEPVVAQEKPSGGGGTGPGHDEDSNPLFVNWKVKFTFHSMFC